MHKRMGLPTVLVAVFAAIIMVSVPVANCSDSSDAATVSGLPVYTADVTPFTFPESRGVTVLNAMYDATSTIDISVYQISSHFVMDVLLKKLDAGVTVRVLTNGNVVGGIPSSVQGMLKKLDDSGADVRIINYPGVASADKRYDYDHNKFVIIDSQKVIVTSENWTQGNFSSAQGNRGWGVMIDNSPSYVAYMQNIFDGDYDDSNADVKKFEDCSYTDIPAYTPTSTYNPTAYSYSTMTKTTKISPVHSPDNSFDSMKKFMGMATARLYAEEMDVNATMSNPDGDVPVGWMVDKAEAGVDVRFVLDSSQNSSKTEHENLVKTLNASTDMKCAAINGGKGLGNVGSFGTTHNKGIIVDDMVWISSVNWTTSSLTKNREMGVIVYDADVTSFYLDYFNDDFTKNFDASQKDLKSYKITFVSEGKTVSSATYIEGDKIVPPKDPTKKDAKFKGWKGYTDGMTATQDMTFEAEFDDGSVQIPWYLALIIVGIAAIGAIMKKSGSKGKSKGKGRKR